MTPGPWTWGVDEAGSGYWVRGDAGTPVVELPSNGHPDPYAEDDARLIAAAPELYECLAGLVANFDAAGFADESWWDGAREAIAKAKGKAP